MFNKKRIEALEKRIADLEEKTGNLSTFYLMWNFDAKCIPNNRTLDARLEKVEELIKVDDYEYEEKTRLVKKPKEEN